MDAVSEANRYFAAEEPWALKKENPERMGTVLYVTAELVRQAAILLQPVIPAGASQLLDLLEIDADKRDFAALGSDYRLAPGISLLPSTGCVPASFHYGRTADS